jgi:small ligand-binding sensory domain FIST
VGMPTAEARAQRRRALIFAISALVVSLAANAFVSVLLILTRSATENYAQCTAQWQQQFSVAYLARSDAAAEVSKAMDDIITAVAERDEDKLRVAVEHYVTLRETQEKERRENPLPPLPETLCGKPGGAP